MLPALLAAALVWLPPENYTHWSKVDELLRARADLKLTVALTPQMATPLAKAALAPWVSLGRVEIAGRVHGDPVLALVAAHPAAPRPDDALERTAEARQSVERRMGVPVPGFVPGAGALDPSLAGPLGAGGASWILTGPYDASASSWAASGKTVFLPARSSTQSWTAPGADVFDESAEPESRFVEALTAASGRARPDAGWALASDLLKATDGTRPPADAVAAWPGWDPAATALADPSARAAWNAYGEAAKALARYQNSGAADLKVLESATSLLRKTQEARFYRAPAAGAPAGLPPELRTRLLAVYKRIKTPAPDALYDVGTSTASAATAEAPTGVHSASGRGWLSFDNPLATTARIPAGAANSDPWRLRGLRVEWDDARVLLRLFVGRADAAPAAPRPVYDVYMDLNHVVGAGSIRLLEGRGAFAQARDAWEFALSVSGGQARLWRAGSGDPEEIATLAAETDPAKAEIRVSVPRETLRGNPSRWGYIVLALAEDPARAGRSPAATLVGPDGALTLGLLAPLEIQKNVLEHPGTPQRVAAARLESAAP